MNLKNLGSQMLKIRINDNDIKEGMIGVMGDTNARNFRVNIVAENNEVLADSSISLKLFVKQGDNLLVTDGEYNNDGTYTVNLPNEVFIEEQTLECQIMIEKADERLFSTVFNKKVERGLLGTVREGRTTSIDLLKAIEFGDTYTEKMKALEDLANDKNLLLIRTADSKLSEYNNNHELKTGLLDSHINRITGEVENYIMRYRDSYNTLFEKHTAEFNSNSDSKLQEYNSNAENKISILSNIQSDVTEKYASINQTAENINGSKSDFETKKSDFDIKYNNISNIINSENERVQAENLRQQHDEKIQKLLTEGLNAELGDYVKKEQLNTELIRKAEANHTHEEFVKINKSYVAQNCVDFNSYDGYKNLNKDIVKSSESYIPFGKIKINIPRVDKSEYKFLVEVVMSSNKTHGQFKLQSPGDTLTNWTEQFQSKWFNISEGGNVYRQVISIPKSFIQAKNYQYVYSKLELRLKVTEGVTVNIHNISVKYLSDNVEYDIDYINNEIRFTDLDIKTRELFQSVSNGKQLIASAITDKGIQTEAISEFSVMADNIRNISSGGMTDEDKRKISELWGSVLLCGNYFNGVDYEIYNWYKSQKNKIDEEHDLLSVEDIINHVYNDIVKMVEKIDLIFNKIDSMKGRSVFISNKYTNELTYQPNESKLDAILDLVKRM